MSDQEALALLVQYARQTRRTLLSLADAIILGDTSFRKPFFRTIQRNEPTTGARPVRLGIRAPSRYTTCTATSRRVAPLRKMDPTSILEKACFTAGRRLFGFRFSDSHLRRQGPLEKEARAVTVIRDDWGIAHVYGKTDADAVFGMVYTQAEDDFNRVETNYINAMGRLAESEGESKIYQDLRMKLFIDPPR